MPSGKDRLYILLYARYGTPEMPKKEDKYHWALLAAPKIESENVKGIRFHARERCTASGQVEWYYDEFHILLKATNMLLVRILIAKIADTGRLLNIIRNIPTRQEDRYWNCIGWVKEALEALWVDKKALGTAVTGWDKVRDAAMNYCQKKSDQLSFYTQEDCDNKMPATYSLLEEKETIP
ncbi:hypothetical protein Golomagni_01285 [Golovinomyces magnicellulatus]|nr:hypothetical protein Golomagni_01285 [Golovinomyces magnicellulatus]